MGGRATLGDAARRKAPPGAPRVPVQSMSGTHPPTGPAAAPRRIDQRTAAAIAAQHASQAAAFGGAAGAWSAGPAAAAPASGPSPRPFHVFAAEGLAAALQPAVPVWARPPGWPTPAPPRQVAAFAPLAERAARSAGGVGPSAPPRHASRRALGNPAWTLPAAPDPVPAAPASAPSPVGAPTRVFRATAGSTLPPLARAPRPGSRAARGECRPLVPFG